MENENTFNIFGSDKLLYLASGALVAVGFSGFLKLMLVQHSPSNALMVLAVSSLTVAAGAYFYVSEKKTKALFQTMLKEGAIEAGKAEKSYREKARKLASYANTLSTSTRDPSTGEQVTVLSTDVASDMSRELAALSSGFADMADDIAK